MSQLKIHNEGGKAGGFCRTPRWGGIELIRIGRRDAERKHAYELSDVTRDVDYAIWSPGRDRPAGVRLFPGGSGPLILVDARE